MAATGDGVGFCPTVRVVYNEPAREAAVVFEGKTIEECDHRIVQVRLTAVLFFLLLDFLAIFLLLCWFHLRHVDPFVTTRVSL